MQRSDLSVFSSAIGERVISLPISIHLRIEFEIGAAHFDISVGISWMPYAHRTCSSAGVEIPNDEMPRSVSVRQPRDGCALGRRTRRIQTWRPERLLRNAACQSEP